MSPREAPHSSTAAPAVGKDGTNGTRWHPAAGAQHRSLPGTRAPLRAHPRAVPSPPAAGSPLNPPTPLPAPSPQLSPSERRAGRRKPGLPGGRGGEGGVRAAPPTRRGARSPRHPPLAPLPPGAGLTWGLQAFLDGLDVGQVRADPLAVHERVQGPRYAAGRVTPEPGAAAGGVNAAGGPAAEGAGRAATAARFPHQLGATLRCFATSQPFLRARRALDRFLAAARSRRRRQQQ